MENLLLTTEELVKLTKFSLRKIGYLKNSGKLPYIKIGHDVRFLVEDVIAFLKNRRVVRVEVENEQKNP